jgi:hypothetical protein
MLLDLVAKPTFVYDFKRLSVGSSVIGLPTFCWARRTSYLPANRQIRERKQILGRRGNSHACFELQQLLFTHRQRSHRISHATRISP